MRHAETEPVVPGMGEQNHRRLSPAGREDAAALAEELARTPVAAVYSSPYPRALETVEPLAERLGMEIVIVDDLRERLLSTVHVDDWYGAVRHSFDDPDHALPGGESGRSAGRRVTAALRTIAARQPGRTVVCASHGNLIALALGAHDPTAGFEFWAAMPMPAVYRIEL